MAQLPNITSVTIPESITAITSDSFTDCPRLATITVAPNNPTYTSIDGLLYNKALTRVLLCPESAEGVVSLPDQTDAVPASALSHCANLHTLLVGQDNVAYTSISGSLYSKDASTLVACPGGIGQTLTLPKQTTTLGPDALAGITTLKSIVVLGTITAIDPSAFNDQSKQSTTIALPGGEDYAARKQVWQNAGFKKFATPANPGDTQTPDQPGEGTQPGDPGDKPTDPSKPASGFTYKLLEDYTLEASWTGELSPESTPIIPATAQLAGLSYTVSALAPKAFAGTALTTIDIPTTITTIGDQAFANCPNLTRLITHTNTIQVAPTALDACTNLEVWCPYNEAETYPWVLGPFATNNHIKAYGLPASQQALTLEVGQSANLFEPGTLQAPDPAKAVYAYEATCLSVSQEGTITAKAPGTTTISTSIELDQTPLTHTTRTISVVAPTIPALPEQPETPTPTPPNAQPITPRYPPNLATPTQASAPLYALGAPGAPQPTLPEVTIKIAAPTVSPISINAVGESSTTAGSITSNTPEPMRVTKITCKENTTSTGAGSLISNLDKGTVRAETKVVVTDKGENNITPPLSLALAGGTWDAKPKESVLFRVEPGSTDTPTSRSVDFGLDIPKTASYNYLLNKEASFASVDFTFDRLALTTENLELTSSNNDINAPKVGNTLTATPKNRVSGYSTTTYTWYALDSATQLLDPSDRSKIIRTETVNNSVPSDSITLTAAHENKFICCQISDNNTNLRPAYSAVSGQVMGNLNDYSWEELSVIADDLSANGTKSDYYPHFHDDFLLVDKAAAAVAVDAAATRNKPQYHKLIPITDLSDPKNPKPGKIEVRIVGINHDAVEIDAKGNPTKTAGLTFMAVHSLPIAYQFNPAPDTNVGGWDKSTLRTSMNSGDIWNTLASADPKLTGAIKQVYKKTSNKGGDGTTGKDATFTQDKLWLPSHSELVNSLWTTSYPWLNDEGKQYEFFRDKVADNTGGNVNKILVDMNKTQANEPTKPALPSPVGHGSNLWWQRSCDPYRAPYFLASNSGGHPLACYGASYQLGVVPGFSL